jgi:hypothetical protein
MTILMFINLPEKLDTIENENKGVNTYSAEMIMWFDSY